MNSTKEFPSLRLSVEQIQCYCRRNILDESRIAFWKSRRTISEGATLTSGNSLKYAKIDSVIREQGVKLASHISDQRAAIHRVDLVRSITPQIYLCR